MGIHGNSTCVMNYDGAKGWLVGEAEKGLAAMFIMMNAARLGVGLQGLAQGEVAYQNAVTYARERRQGRALHKDAQDQNAKADPLFVHPDVRRMLMEMRSFNQAARALILWGALQVDLSRRAQSEEERQRADDLVSLITPVIKGYLTDKGFEATVWRSRSSAVTATSASTGWSSSSATPGSPRSTKARTASRRWTSSAASSPRTAAAPSSGCSSCCRGHRGSPSRRALRPFLAEFQRAVGDLQASTIGYGQRHCQSRQCRRRRLSLHEHDGHRRGRPDVAEDGPGRAHRARQRRRRSALSTKPSWSPLASSRTG